MTQADCKRAVEQSPHGGVCVCQPYRLKQGGLRWIVCAVGIATYYATRPRPR